MLVAHQVSAFRRRSSGRWRAERASSRIASRMTRDAIVNGRWRAASRYNTLPRAGCIKREAASTPAFASSATASQLVTVYPAPTSTCLLYTSDAADERSSVDLGG